MNIILIIILTHLTVSILSMLVSRELNRGRYTVTGIPDWGLHFVPALNFSLLCAGILFLIISLALRVTDSLNKKNKLLVFFKKITNWYNHE